MDIGSQLRRIDRVTQQVSARFGSLSPEQLNWRPDRTAWSIGQILEHVMIVNRTEYGAFDALLDETHKRPLAARLPWWPGLVGRFILRSQAPDNQRKTRTLALWQPPDAAVGADVVRRFAEHQDDLGRRFRRLAALDGSVVIASPLNRAIVYPLAAAVELVVTHEERHLRQMESVLALLTDTP